MEMVFAYQMNYSQTSALVSFRTCQTLSASHSDERKNAVGTCLGLLALARTRGITVVCPQEKTTHPSVLVGFGTCHEFWNGLTMSAEVPLCLKLGIKEVRALVNIL